MQAVTESPPLPWAIVGEHMRFIGKPSSCLGNIHLRNRTDEKLRVKRIPLSASKLAGPVKVLVRDLEVFAVLPPGAEAHICCKIPLPPQTPPGKYSAQALMGEARKPVLVDVLESWDIALIPTELSLRPADGKRLVHTIQVTNHGNMPWEIHGAALAPLQEKNGIHRNIFLSLKNCVKGGYEGVLNDFAARMKETVVEPAKIKIISKTAFLQPGETREMDLEISLPANVKRNRRYSGEVPFENARLLLDIEVRGKSAAKKELKS